MTKTVLVKTMLESYSWPQFSDSQSESMVWLAKNYGSDLVLESWKEFQSLQSGHSPAAFREWFLEKQPAVIEFT